MGRRPRKSFGINGKEGRQGGYSRSGRVAQCADRTARYTQERFHNACAAFGCSTGWVLLEQEPARLLPVRRTDLVKPRQVAREVKLERRAREGSCSQPGNDLDEVRRVYARGRGDGAQHSPRGRRDRTVPGAADAGPAGVPGGEDRGGTGRGGIYSKGSRHGVLGGGGGARRAAAADGVRHLPGGRHHGGGVEAGAARRACVEPGSGARRSLCAGGRRERVHRGSGDGGRMAGVRAAFRLAAGEEDVHWPCAEHEGGGETIRAQRGAAVRGAAADRGAHGQRDYRLGAPRRTHDRQQFHRRRAVRAGPDGVAAGEGADQALLSAER